VAKVRRAGCAERRRPSRTREGHDAERAGAGHHESPGKRGLTDIAARSWSYVTLGYGHGEQWWRAFCYRLRMAGYDGWLSIEHEDVI